MQFSGNRKGNILSGLIFYYDHSSQKHGAGVRSKKQNYKKRQDENMHIVERRGNTGEIIEASWTWREGPSTIIKLGWMHSLEPQVSNRKQDNRATDGCSVGREGGSRWQRNSGGKCVNGSLKIEFQVQFQALSIC